MKGEITSEIVREFLDYDPDTGLFEWKKRDRRHFKSNHAFNAWNAKMAGNAAFTSTNGRGYSDGGIFGKTVRAHRIAWLHYYGTQPDHIDHINGIRTDNRICNLRSVTNAENRRNQKRRTDNTSGVAGVRWHKQAGKWNARIRLNGKEKSLGVFVDKQAAIAARKKAEKEHGFHANHGR